MELGIDGKTAIVGGSSKGIGKASAAELARSGANVVICGRHEESLEAAAADIRERTDGTVLPVVTDLTHPEDIESLVSATREEFGGVDILIGNAGGPSTGQFEDFDDEDWTQAFELNLLSNVRLVDAVLPDMTGQQWGRVVFITSLVVKEPLPNFLLSTAVRPGVHGLSKSLSNQYASENVTFNCVMPGYTLTNRLEEVYRDEAEKRNLTLEEHLSDVASDIPADRLADPEEISALVAFLASERASYVTGTSLAADGGCINTPW